MSTVQFLNTDGGERIAYEKIEGGVGHPTLLYVPGYGGTKDGDKSMYLRGLAAELGYGMVRYDPLGLGESTQIPEETIEFKDWLRSGEEVLSKLCAQNTILVGSSMGAWISLLLATHPALKQNIKGIVLIAPAINFFSKFFKSATSALPKEALDKIEAGETYLHTDPASGRITLLRKSFFERTLEHHLNGEIGVEVPVSILHGVQDETIPFESSIPILQNIRSKDVELTFVKNSEHRFQDPESLEYLKDRVEKMIHKVNKLLLKA